MAINADNLPNDSETLSASAQQFHNSLFDDQNLTSENFRPSVVSTPINSDHEVFIFEQIDDSSKESFEESVACGLWHVQSSEFQTRRQRLAPLIDRPVQVSLGKCITLGKYFSLPLCIPVTLYTIYNSYKIYFHVHISTEEH